MSRTSSSSLNSGAPKPSPYAPAATSRSTGVPTASRSSSSNLTATAASSSGTETVDLTNQRSGSPSKSPGLQSRSSAPAPYHPTASDPALNSADPSAGPGSGSMEPGGDGQDDGQEISSQAMEILAGLASLGISNQLRERVQDALSQLTEVSQAAAAGIQGSDVGTSTLGGGSGFAVPLPPHTNRAVEEAYKKKIATLEQKQQMSRSIMRKLYYKNVELEKEINILKANATGVNFTDATAALLGHQAGSGADRPSTAPVMSPMAVALQVGKVPVCNHLNVWYAFMHKYGIHALDLVWIHIWHWFKAHLHQMHEHFL